MSPLGIDVPYSRAKKREEKLDWRAQRMYHAQKMLHECEVS